MIKDFGFIYNKVVVAITPSILYHPSTKILEIRWLYWSIAVRFSKKSGE